VYKKQFKGVRLKSGYFYKFKYKAYEHDPKPTIIFMHSIEGLHPNTGHQWRLFQTLNFSYIPRSQRKKFMNVWLKELDRPGNIKFTWQKVLGKYPYLKRGIRRYQFKPADYITNLEEIPLENVEREIVKTYIKDFSKRITIGLRGLLAKRRKSVEKKKKVKAKKKKARVKEIDKQRKARAIARAKRNK
jgi:hypothetical protein